MPPLNPHARTCIVILMVMMMVMVLGCDGWWHIIHPVGTDTSRSVAQPTEKTQKTALLRLVGGGDLAAQPSAIRGWRAGKTGEIGLHEERRRVDGWGVVCGGMQG
jgi:hypothetical protein